MRKIISAVLLFITLLGCGGERVNNKEKEITRDSLAGMWVYCSYKEYQGDESGEYTDMSSNGFGVTYNFHTYTRECIMIRNFVNEQPDTMSTVILRSNFNSLTSSWYINTTMNERWEIKNDSLFIERYKGNFNANFYDGQVPSWYKIQADDTLTIRSLKYKISKITNDTLLLQHKGTKMLFRKCDKDSDIEKIVNQERKRRR